MTVGCLPTVYQRFHVMLQWCNCGNLGNWQCQVCGKWPSLTKFPCHWQPCRYCPRPSLNVPAQSGVISPVAQNQRTLHLNILILQTICSFNLAVSDQVLQRLEDAKQKTRGQCSILKELASYSTTAFGLCYTDLNMSATSRQLDIYDHIMINNIGLICKI